MLEVKNVTGPHLIVVPKSTLSNWMKEIRTWAPTLKAIRFHGDKETREDLVRTRLEPAQRDEERDWNVCVTTYEVCNIEKSTLGKFAWSYLYVFVSQNWAHKHAWKPHFPPIFTGLLTKLIDSRMKPRRSARP
jgi:hypothetical protein